MFCPQCGKNILDITNFCPQCGTRIAQPSPASGVGSLDSFSQSSGPSSTIPAQERRYIEYAFLGTAGVMALGCFLGLAQRLFILSVPPGSLAFLAYWGYHELTVGRQSRSKIAAACVAILLVINTAAYALTIGPSVGIGLINSICVAAMGYAYLHL